MKLIRKDVKQFVFQIPRFSQQFNSPFHSSSASSGRALFRKLQKPEDKTSIVLGKRKDNIEYSKEGVSDKVNKIEVKWVRPKTMESVNPQISGDIGGLEYFDQVDMSMPKLKYEGTELLEQVSPEVKKVLSLEFSRRKDWIEKLGDEVIKSVQRHPRDYSSLEVKIALKTVNIRNLQNHLIELYPYKNQPAKGVLTRKITSRRKDLEKLRSLDYKKYEWLLEKLNLFYKPMPWDAPRGVLIHKENIARKASIEKLTDLWCSELRRHRLAAYRRSLEEQQPTFLREKADTLARLRADEEELGIELTITQEEIDECRLKADAIEKGLLEKGDDDDDDEYLIYREDIVKEENIYIGKS